MEERYVRQENLIIRNAFSTTSALRGTSDHTKFSLLFIEEEMEMKTFVISLAVMFLVYIIIRVLTRR